MLNTKICKIDDNSLNYAKNLISNNQLVAFPTETVYINGSSSSLICCKGLVLSGGI